MTQAEPRDLGELWRLIQHDSQVTRDSLRRELDDMKQRLESYVTKDQFDAEKRLLEARIRTAEDKLEQLERSTREERSTRQHTRREFVYKGIIPALALIVAIVSIVVTQ
ncbi:hypothetical protein ACPCSE_29545 [Streptomyces cellulosae]